MVAMSLGSADSLVVAYEQIRQARGRIADLVITTPVVRMPTGDGREVWLKLETLQPIGSMKLRGVLNAVRSAPTGQLDAGLVTTSSGNFGRAVAWVARHAGIPAVVAVPDHAPPSKVSAITDLGARVVKLPYSLWWDALLRHKVDGVDGHFIHPVLDADVVAGAGTIGLEIAEQVPEVDTLVVPFGGGSLALGVASAMAHVSPGTRVFACEPATGAPLTASMRAGRETAVDFKPSFIDAAGSPSLLPGVWERASCLLAGAVEVTLAETAEAIRAIVREARVTAEGAGALSTAAVLGGRIQGHSIVCVVSGGNLEPQTLAQILCGRTPG